MRYVLLVALVSSPVAAQEPRDTTTLPPITVTATRVPLRLDLVASSVTVLTAAQLRAAGYKTVAEALRDMPAASVIESGSFGGQTSLFLRGGESDYTKVLLDGVPLNQPGGALDFADLSLDNVERIEVARGPGSVLYGSDAMAGVVQIFTRAGSGPARVSAGARVGSYGSRAVEAGLAGAAGDLSYSAGLERFTATGTLPFNNQYERSAASARVRLAPDARGALDLTVRYGDGAYHYPTDGAGRLVDSNQFRFERGPVWKLEGAYRLTPRVGVRVSYGVHDVRQGIDDSADSPADTLGFFGFQGRDHVVRRTFETRVDWQGPATVVSLGAELERQRIDGTSESQSQFGPFTDPPLNERRQNDAVYVQAIAGLEGPLTFQAGSRIDNNTQYGRRFTGRTGVVYRLDANTRVRAGLGSGFKEPTFFETFARGFVHGNPDLRPERTRSWEAGLEHHLGPATIGLTYFDQQFSDLIEFTFTPAPPDTVNYFNVTGASADGVEVEVATQLGRGWSGSVRYTYLDTRVTDPGIETGPDAAFSPGKRLIRRPTHQGLAQLQAPLGARGSARLAVRYLGDRDDMDFTSFPATRVKLRAAARVDLSAEYELPLGLAGVVASARIENLFADDARDVANLPARGRVVFVGGQLRVAPR
jgi:vitamin B12 transporter